MHRRHCVGVDREIGTSRECPRPEWQAPAFVVQQFAAGKSERGERGRSGRSSFDRAPVPPRHERFALMEVQRRPRDVGDMDYEDSWSDEGSGSSPMNESYHVAPDDVPATSEWPGADGPFEAGRATVVQRAPAAGSSAQSSTRST